MTFLPNAKHDGTIDPTPNVALSFMDPSLSSPPPPQPPPPPLPSPPRLRRRRRTTTTPHMAIRRSPRLYGRTVSNLLQVQKTEWSHYDDITLDILSRLSTKSLARLICVCKGWQRTISSPFFLITQLQKKGIKSKTGFIVQDEFFTRHYIPIGDSKLNLQPILFRSLPRDYLILASCNGLICYRNNTSPESESFVCVSNLVDNHFIKLRSLEMTDSEINIAFACVENFIKFKLVRVVQKTRFGIQLGFEFELYSSETGEWRVPNDSSYIAAPYLVMNNKGICVGNVLYWLTYDKPLFTYDKKILVFDIEKNLAQLIRGPIKRFDNMSYHMLGESHGSLHYVLATKDLGLRVWCLESYSDVNWTLRYRISSGEIYGKYRHCFPGMNPRVWWMLENDMLIPLGFKDSVLLLKIDKDVMEYDIRNDEMVPSCPFKDLNLRCFFPSPSSSVFPFHVLG